MSKAFVKETDGDEDELATPEIPPGTRTTSLRTATSG